MDYTMTKPKTEHWSAMGHQATLSSLQLEMYGENMLHAPASYTWNMRQVIDAVSNERTPAINTEIEAPFLLQTQIYGQPLHHMITMDSAPRHWRFSKWNGAVDTLMKHGCPYIEQN